MGYAKTNWQTGDVVTAEKLNKIENELENISGPAPVVRWSWEGTVEQFFNMITFKSFYTNNYYVVGFLSINETLFTTEGNEFIQFKNGEAIGDPSVFNNCYVEVSSLSPFSTFVSKAADEECTYFPPYLSEITSGTLFSSMTPITNVSSQGEAIEKVKQQIVNNLGGQDVVLKFVVQQHIEEETPTESGSSMFIIKSTDYDSEYGTWSKINKTYDEIVAAIENGMVPILYLVDNGTIVYSYIGRNNTAVTFVNYDVNSEQIVAKTAQIGQSGINKQTAIFSKN